MSLNDFKLVLLIEIDTYTLYHLIREHFGYYLLSYYVPVKLLVIIKGYLIMQTVHIT